jgi:putative heme transporter
MKKQSAKNETPRKKRIRLRNILTLAGLIGLAIVVLLNGHQLANFVHLIKHLRWYVLILVVAVQLASYYVNALYYRSILKLFGYKIGLPRLFEGALAANFVNYILPSLGLAGAGYLSQVLDPDVPRGESVLVQLTRYALSALAVLVMMPVGFAFIFFSSESGQRIVRVTLLSAAAITVLGLAVIILIQHEALLRRSVERFINIFSRFFSKLKQQNINGFIDEFYKGYHIMTRGKTQLLAPFGWSLIYIIIEISTFYLAFLAFGKWVGPGIVILAYLFANIASIFGGVFFSTGVFELGMAGTLVALGLPFTLAFSVTVVYRVVNLIIGLPPGYFYYRKYLP